MAGLRDTESSKENHQRFVRHLVESELVWGLRNMQGWATCDSNSADSGSVTLFWSGEPFAKRSRDLEFHDFEPASIPLFDFLFRWLSGMERDGALIGANWTVDLVGLEYKAIDLKNEIMMAMKPETLNAYRERLAAELKKTSTMRQNEMP